MLRTDLPLKRPVVRGEASGVCGHTHLNVRLDYSKGGRNYYTGQDDPRGVWLYVSPVEKGDGFTRQIMGKGSRFLIEEMQRKNPKRVEKLGDQLCDQLDSRKGELWDKIALTLDRLGLELEDPADPLEQVAAELDALKF